MPKTDMIQEVKLKIDNHCLKRDRLDHGLTVNFLQNYRSLQLEAAFSHPQLTGHGLPQAGGGLTEAPSKFVDAFLPSRQLDSGILNS